MTSDPAQRLAALVDRLDTTGREKLSRCLGIAQGSLPDSEEIEARLAMSLRLRALASDERPN